LCYDNSLLENYFFLSNLNVTFHSQKSQIVGFSFWNIAKKKYIYNYIEKLKNFWFFFLNQYSLFKHSPFTWDIIGFSIRGWIHIEISTCVKVHISKKIPNCRFLSILVLLSASFGKLVWSRRYGRETVYFRWETIIFPRIFGWSIEHCVLIIFSISRLSSVFSPKIWFYIIPLRDAISWRWLSVETLIRACSNFM